VEPSVGEKPPTEIPGERKLVTAVFCDLVGSTQLAERLDPEEYRELLDQYFEIALAEINRMDGFTTQLAGDGVMALFGAPIAHEDAPQRAVRAALAIRDDLANLNRRLQAEGDIDLQVRIGVHTGPVVVGVMGGGRTMSYTAVGDTTNVVARLQAMASPGSVLISEATYRLVQGFFHVAPAGSLELRGKSERVVAYEVLALQEAVTPIAIARARGLTPFVGRASELTQLMGCFERLGDDVSQVVSLVGDAGSGKSRLLYEFRQRIPADEAYFFETRCSSLSQAIPYGPFIAMLRQYFGVRADGPPEAACEEVLRQLRNEDGELDPSHRFLCRLLAFPVEGLEHLPGEQIRKATFEAVARLVMRLSEHQPVVMIVEDLQWMDESSREMLDLALLQMRVVRLMLVVSHRSDFVPAWRTGAALMQLRLQPLSNEHMRQIVRSVAGGNLPAPLEERILVKSEGNPFFGEEITRALLEERYLLRRDGAIALTRPVEEIRIPNTIHEVIAARLDRLPPPAKRVAQLAAVFGRQFHRDDVTELLRGEDVDVATVLEDLERRGIIHRKNLLSDKEFRFGESLMQEIAYEGLLLRERRRLHDRIGLLLEERGEDISGERAALIAQHFARGDDPQRAVHWLLRAGRHAEELPSYPAAIRFYGQAWELAEGLCGEGAEVVEPTARLAMDAALRFCWMVVFYGSSQTARSEQAARRGREIARVLGSAEAAAAFNAFLGLIVMGSARERFSEGLDLVERGFAEALDGGFSLTALNISRGLAYGYLHDGRFELARRTFEWVVSELDTTGEAEKLSDFYLGACLNRDMTCYMCDDLAAALSGAARTHELGLRVGNSTIQGAASGALAVVHFLRGEYAAAKEWADRGLEIGEQVGNVAAIRTGATIAVGARAALGERLVDGCLDRIEQNLEAPGDLAGKCYLIVDVLLAVGEVERARHLAEVAYAHAGGRFREGICAVALGEVALRQGPERWSEAARWYDRAQGLAEVIGARSLLAAARIGAGELALAQGDCTRGTELIRLGLAACEELDFVRYRSRAESLLCGQSARLEKTGMSLA
jgi:class 3 adenylate cyclase/tetratricopeptide (TPR) repeat protein